MRTLRVWWSIFKTVGTGMRAGRQGDQIFRFFILQALEEAGFFSFLSEPRTYGDILAQFEFEDNEYTHEVLEVLVHDRQNAIVRNSETYVRNPEVQIPDLEDLLAKTDKRIRQMMQMAETMSDNILGRMRAERKGFKEVFEGEGQRVVKMFNNLLSGGIYSGIRRGTFAFLTAGDRRWLIGKQMLEIGCGNGLETAELWLLTGGRTRITAVDSVPSMVELAEGQFDAYLDQIAADHGELTMDNRPEFKLADAMRLPFDDGSYDAVFWQLMLHWTPEPWKAIAEAVRVLRPGGLMFGAQSYKPYVQPYLDLVIRSSRNSYGMVWKEDMLRWFHESGLEVEMVTPAGIFRAHKPG